MKKQVRFLVTLSLLSSAFLPNIAAAEDAYCRDLMTAKVQLQQILNESREKMRNATSADRREWHMNKYEDAYVRYSAVDREFTANCRY